MTLLPTPMQWLAAVAVSGVGAALVVLLPAASPAYLAAFTVVAALPLGSAALLMLFHCTAGGWGEAIRPRLEAAAAITPLLAILFIPIAISATHLYPWVFAESTESPRQPYWNPTFAAIRAALILVIWAIGGAWLAAASRAVPSGERGGPRVRAVCAAGLIVYVLTVTFGFTDWIASLQPHWHSSIFGVIIICSQGLTALGFATGAAAYARRSASPTPAALRDLGSLLLAFALLHAYVAFSQFFIIWNGDVPERTSWYIPRTRGLWFGIILVIVVVQFALPFTAMLFRGLKSSRGAMVGVAGLLLVGACLEAAWLTLPSTPLDGVTSRATFLPLALGLLLLIVLAARPLRSSAALPGDVM